MMPGAAARRRRRGRADDDATRRLETRVAAETAEQRARLAADATMVDALLRAREPEAASAVLDEHQVALRAFADRLHHALADACSEREAQARRSAHGHLPERRRRSRRPCW